MARASFVPHIDIEHYRLGSGVFREFHEAIYNRNRDSVFVGLGSAVLVSLLENGRLAFGDFVARFPRLGRVGIDGIGHRVIFSCLKGRDNEKRDPFAAVIATNILTATERLVTNKKSSFGESRRGTISQAFLTGV